MRRGQLEREWRIWPERNQTILMEDNYYIEGRGVRRGDLSTWGRIERETLNERAERNLERRPESVARAKRREQRPELRKVS